MLYYAQYSFILYTEFAHKLDDYLIPTTHRYDKTTRIPFLNTLIYKL